MNQSKIALLSCLLSAAALAAGCLAPAPEMLPPGYGQISPTTYEASSGITVTEDYRIHPGDLVEIRFPFHKEEDSDGRVRPDGKISLPLLGEVPAAGLTPEELGQRISEQSSELLVDPAVSISVRRFGEQRVYVGGEVRNPGFVPYYPGLTPLLAVIQRGGFKATADPEKVVWISGSASAENYKVQETDLKAVISGEATERLVLGPDDVVYVPPSRVGKMNNFMDLYVRGIIPTIPRASFRLPP